MIQFYIRSRTYGRDELIGYLRPYFSGDEDVEMFIDALLQTNQISKRGKEFYFPATHERRLVRPKYFRFQTIVYGGAGEEQRIGVRGSYDFVQRYGYPTELYLISVYKRGEWKRLDERISLRISKGRLPLTIESWRASIPRRISTKYRIKPYDYVTVRVDTVTHEYFTLLSLWGFEHEETMTFEYTRSKVNERHLELRGTEFVNEMSGRDIVRQTERTSEQIQTTMDGLLYEGDPEYYAASHHAAFDTITGSTIIPLKEHTSKAPNVKFTDLDREDVLLEWSTRQPFDRIPEQSDFILKRTRIRPRRVPGAMWW